MGKRIVLIGAGSAQFGYGTMGDIFQSKVLEGSHIVLHDINPKTMAVVEKTGQDFIQEHNLPFTLSATTNREEALQGADFIVISIEIGDRFELWEQDWRIPQQYGIRQVYGENGGPGGLFHSMRIIPPILDICGDIMRICPNAVVFNFSNPMSRIVTTVMRKYPDCKFIGMCHEIASIRMLLPFILGVPFEELETRSAGLNHFSCLLEAKYRTTGKDAYPEIREKAPKFFESMPTYEGAMKVFKETGKWPTRTDEVSDDDREYWPERFLFKEILEKFGLMPITTDSHFGEYIQWAHEAVDHAGILDFYHRYKGHLAHIEPKIELRLSERIIPIIEGIVTDSGYEEAAVNVLNDGLIDHLPAWLAVEVPAIIDKDGVHGVKMGQLPHGFLGLLQNQVAVHDLTAEAILHQSRDLALQALLVDPIVDKFVNVEEMLDTMLKLQSKHLGYLK
ncbi:MAG: alpha-glucosidase [Anaerolineaceae bacterium]|nr:alpha-glucosidase [Anaerolineaceae bacterium]